MQCKCHRHSYILFGLFFLRRGSREFLPCVAVGKVLYRLLLWYRSCLPSLRKFVCAKLVGWCRASAVLASLTTPSRVETRNGLNWPVSLVFFSLGQSRAFWLATHFVQNTQSPILFRHESGPGGFLRSHRHITFLRVGGWVASVCLSVVTRCASVV